MTLTGIISELVSPCLVSALCSSVYIYPSQLKLHMSDCILSVIPSLLLARHVSTKMDFAYK